MRITDTSDLWWKSAVIYCLDVETYLDSDGDGIGDLQGLEARLDARLAEPQRVQREFGLERRVVEHRLRPRQRGEAGEEVRDALLDRGGRLGVETLEHEAHVARSAARPQRRAAAQDRQRGREARAHEDGPDRRHGNRSTKRRPMFKRSYTSRSPRR